MQKSLVETLEKQAEYTRGHATFHFLSNGDVSGPVEHMTLQELCQSARDIGAMLVREGAARQPVLLLIEPGLGFVRAFFGCLYAGAIAVPAYPPELARKARRLERLTAMLRNCQCKHALVSSSLRPLVEPLLRAQKVAVHKPEDAASEAGFQPNPTEVALLQYTSGSTGSPRGVVLSHTNLLANLDQIRTGFRSGAETRLVSWLPPYHDMGLIGGILHPIHVGAEVLSFSPFHFLQEPTRWLRAIHHFSATASGGPNFAYDLARKKATESVEAELDLTTWAIAFNGAEPVRQATLTAFAHAFVGCGFRAEAFAPCYGLAEATLLVSTVSPGAAGPTSYMADGAALERGVVTPASAGGRTSPLVGCGETPPGVEVAVVDPNDCTELDPGSVGEVWVRGANVATRYYDNATATGETFGRSLRGTADWLATGDLGARVDGQLFITGRSKDTIIVNGRNIYPQDLEATVGTCHPGIREGNVVAFANGDGSERESVVVVAEVRSATAQLEAIAATVRLVLATEHDLGLVQVHLIAGGGVLKTSSGKLARAATRRALEEQALTVLHATPSPSLRDQANAAPLYAHLATTFRRLDARNLRYQFDLESDMAWHQLNAPGVYYPAPLLQSYGYDVEAIVAQPGAWDMLQWRTALSIALGFELLEEALLGFTVREARHFGGAKSLTLLEDEERKHIALFSRYAAHLMAANPTLAPVVRRDAQQLRGHLLAFADPSQFPSLAAYHYCWWLLILFFEELTIWLGLEMSHCAEVQPAWLCAHRLHAREESQHVLTDFAFLQALQVTDEERLAWSELVFERIAPQLAFAMSPESALALVVEHFPAVSNRGRLKVQQGSSFSRLLQSGAFTRTCAAGPYFAKVRKEHAGAAVLTFGGDASQLEQFIIDWVRASAGLTVTSEQNLQSAGLDSVHAIGLAGALERHIGQVLPGSTVYEHPTPRALSRAVSWRLQSPNVSSPPADAPRLLARQRRLLALDAAHPGAVLDHVTAVFTLPLNVVHRVPEALQGIARRHGQLWSRVQSMGAQQDLAPLGAEVPLPLARVHAPFDDTRLQERAAALDGAAFDLGRDPPWRAELWTSEERAALVLVVHHAFADAWSMDVLFGELVDRCAGSPSSLELDSGLARERHLLASADGARRLVFWKQRLADHPDCERPSQLGQRIGRASCTIDAKRWEHIQALARQLSTTPYLVLLTVFGLAWRRATGRDDVLVATHLFNRTTEAERRAVNYLVNLMALRCELTAELTFEAAVERVRSVWLDALEHQLPIDHLVREVFGARYRERWMPARVAFNWLLTSASERDGWTWRHDLAPTPQFLFFDAMFVVLPAATHLELTLWYDELVLAREDAAALLGDFAAMVEKLATAPSAPALRIEELR